MFIHPGIGIQATQLTNTPLQVWTRYFPLSIYVRDTITSGKLGTVYRTSADLSMSMAPEDTFADSHRMVNPDLAGVVVAPGRQRDGPLDLLAQRGEVVTGQVAPRELRADGDHAAADVDPDGGGDDRAQRGDDRADGRPLAQVRIRHQGEVRVDEGHAGRRLRLSAGLRCNNISGFAAITWYIYYTTIN